MIAFADRANFNGTGYLFQHKPSIKPISII